jgi:AcrR family transcriptional regulator
MQKIRLRRTIDFGFKITGRDMGNKERIIEAAKLLFNEQGVAAVGTNRIAAHLGISPGNLYYHFQNKEEIIRAIFPEISAATEQGLFIHDNDVPPEDRLSEILKNWITVVWEYRFFYSNLVELLRKDPELKSLYLARRDATMAFLKQAYLARSKTENRTPNFTDEDAEILATNVWIVALNWIRYLQIDKDDTDITQVEIERGAKHIFHLLKPYLDPDLAGKSSAQLSQK